MIKTLATVTVVFLSLLVSAVSADTMRSWAGPMVELRYGGSLIDHRFGLWSEGQARSLDVSDATTMGGIKVGWRFPLGDRLTFGPMLAYYHGGVEASAAGKYLPEAITASLDYRETRAVTAGLQLGVDLGSGWFAYGEVGYVCQEIELTGTVSTLSRQEYHRQTGYPVGRYIEGGLAKSWGEHVYTTLAVQSRQYGHVDESTAVARNETAVFLGFGVRW